ncbi:hypothetical protein N7492_003411 [Penicillium capsulatum]|uniref:U4/U6.U5 small nuclear ribonucleoprotein 27kDa protein domain-containing protein n=1 Tax=Penicillium capsulatum TaxID=69766 RepID=A0A9W9IN32_9EURO|nr:hypothetical protein N7492_003411 [Penicillium capsulatum]KAJ6122006.1 hypothetical protein N7512_004471 [Penicillium capsulatum]
MTEPPSKRPRRVDSSAMWEKDNPQSRSQESDAGHGRRPRDDRRDNAREDRRYRSRSRDRQDRRQDRSWSRDRRDRDRKGREVDGRGTRDRRGSVSRDRGYNRRGRFKQSNEASALHLAHGFCTGYTARDDKLRDRSRSRSPARNGTKDRSRSPPSRGYRIDRRPDRKDPRSRDQGRRANGASGPAHHKDEMEVDWKEDADEDEMEAMMRKSMGFTRFRTTKNTKVPGNDIYGVRKEKKTEYRQYMNRTGGFNRPLSPSR